MNRSMAASSITQTWSENNGKDPFVLTRAKVKIITKAKADEKDNIWFLLSPRFNFFAFAAQKDKVFQEAQVVPLSLFQTFDWEENTHTYKGSLSDGVQLHLTFRDPSFVETFNQVLLHGLKTGISDVDNPKEYYRYLLGSLEENRQLERSHILEPDQYVTNGGNLTTALTLPALRQFSFVTDDSKETIFKRRVWLGVVKVTKHGMDKSLTEVSDSMSKNGKPMALLLVTAKQVVDYKTEPVESYPKIFQNVIDALSLPGWLDSNVAYVFELPTPNKTVSQNGFFPFKQALSMQ